MNVTLNRHIEITPEVRGGKPRLAGTRITVADVAIMYLRRGQSLEEIAGKYQLSLAAVYAAIAIRITPAAPRSKILTLPNNLP